VSPMRRLRIPVVSLITLSANKKRLILRRAAADGVGWGLDELTSSYSFRVNLKFAVCNRLQQLGTIRLAKSFRQFVQLFNTALAIILAEIERYGKWLFAFLVHNLNCNRI